MRYNTRHPRLPSATSGGGFTLIEMLLVIGVMALLIALLVIGLRGPSNTARRQETATIFDNLKANLEELRRSDGLRSLEAALGPLLIPVSSPGSVLENAPGRNGQAVQKTGLALRVLASIPANRDSLSKMPQDRQMTVVTVAGNLIVPLDAWRNPILFVPSGGLTGVTVAGQMATITSNGPILGPAPAPATARPFWASAGADGNFSTGDDNVYSFQQ